MTLTIVLALLALVLAATLGLVLWRQIMATTNPGLAALSAAVAANSTVTASAVAIINGSAGAAADADSAVAALAATLQENNTTLQAAVTAATPPPPPALAVSLAGGASPSITGSVGAAYSQALDITGGTGPYAVSADTLPEGISLDSTSDTLSGTFGAAGSTTTTITVVDSANPSDTVTLSLSWSVS